MPKESNDSLNLPESLALTALLGADNRVFYYAGDFNEAVRAHTIYETSYSTYDGIGKAIREKQNEIETSKRFPEGKKGMMLRVKPTGNSNFKNVIDA